MLHPSVPLGDGVSPPLGLDQARQHGRVAPVGAHQLVGRVRVRVGARPRGGGGGGHGRVGRRHL
eukprot:scaffold60739_cov27-Phaeocystis_antarctica.AAC.1